MKILFPCFYFKSQELCWGDSTDKIKKQAKITPINLNMENVGLMDSKRRFVSHFGISWVVLCLVLAVHVADEAVNGFLTVYNPLVRTIKEHLPFLPLPEFTFEVWLGGLILGLLILLLLSPLAFRQVKWLRYFSYIFGILMIFNGIIHFAGSIYLGRPMPGVYSSPFLIASSIYLLLSLRLSNRKISAQ